MAIKLPSNIDFASLGTRIKNQFRDLNPRDPSTWPAVPRYALFCVVLAVVVALLWFFWLNGYDADLDASRAKEQEMREEYKKKLAQAVNLDALKKQREQVQQHVTQLEKQLPSKAEMDALLSDINQAGLGRSLQFELFRPGQVLVKDYYAELPITLKVTGRYHDVGAFASDVANLSRIVTLNNLSLTPLSNGNLALDATAKTFRYLDASEIAAQRKPGAGKPGSEGAKK